MIVSDERLSAWLVEVDEGAPVEPGDHVRGLDPSGRERLEHAARQAQRALPVPIGPHVDDDDARRHRLLDRVLAWIAAVRGEPDALLSIARDDWLAGGTHADYLRLLLEHGRTAQALSTARALLEHPDCSDRGALEALIAEAARPPSGWSEAVAAFARRPTRRGWDELLRFTPPGLYDQRVRYTLRLLRELDVDAATLFRCATHEGVVPEAIELVDKGEVEPRVVLERADRAPPGARGLWLGLAARAACVRGDGLGTVRLLREAYAVTERVDALVFDLQFVRDHADGALLDLLDRAGLPPG